MKSQLRLVERGLIPTPVLRWGIRRLLAQRLREQRSIFDSNPESAFAAWLESMRQSPVALVPEKANEQHYEVPAAFFEAVLGPHLKYSSCLYRSPSTSLGEAEADMLALTCDRADLRDGQRVLELGCGWGSLSLWMAEHYPASSITAVSNSASQREHILARAAERGLSNLEILTCDMNAFGTDRRFDRVVSVEMFEHMRNWESLLQRIAGWLDPNGRLFIHVFAHRHYAYPFEVKDDTDWMAEHFFSGGMMPSHDLIRRIESPFVLDEQWVVDGTHYARTSEDWLARLDANKDALLPILERTYGVEAAPAWFQRWRLFFLSCAELFGYRDGEEWWVSHTRLRPARETESR